MTAPANACACHKCAGACEVKPGWFAPDQIAPLAERMGLTKQELFDQHLSVDWYERDLATEKFTHVLAPATIAGNAGREWGKSPYGQCHWFQDGKCAIHDLGKPAECAAFRHDQSSDESKQRHWDVGEQWKSVEAQAKIHELLGREIKEPEPWSMFDDMHHRLEWAEREKERLT